MFGVEKLQQNNERLKFPVDFVPERLPPTSPLCIRGRTSGMLSGPKGDMISPHYMLQSLVVFTSA